MKLKYLARHFYFLPLAGLLLLAACGGKFFPDENSGSGGTTGSTGTTGTTTSGNYLYVSNSSTSVSSIAGYTIANSALGALSNSPYAAALPPNSLAISPKDTFVYSGSVSGGIYVYVIGSDGSLALGNNGQPVLQNVSPLAMRVDPTGQWLLVADVTPSLTVFSIDQTTGVLTQVGSQLGLDTGSVDRLYITPNGKYAYVSLQTTGVDIISFDTATGNAAKIGILSPMSSVDADLGLASDANSTYLFVTETGINALRVLTINANGSLTELSTSPVKTGLGPSQVIVTASGYVYVTNRTDGTVSGFAMTANGALTALSGSPYATGAAPVDLTLDKTGGYVAVACSGGNPDMQVFSIDTATPGKLDSFATQNTGTDPTAVSAVVATQ